MGLNDFLMMQPAVSLPVASPNWVHYAQHITLNGVPIALKYSLRVSDIVRGKTTEAVSCAVVKAIDDKLVTTVALMPSMLGDPKGICQQIRERYEDPHKLAVFLRQALMSSGLGFIEFTLDPTIA
jgi:hypothetical protein